VAPRVVIGVDVEVAVLVLIAAVFDGLSIATNDEGVTGVVTLHAKNRQKTKTNQKMTLA
jgi:hypothetical protein